MVLIAFTALASTSVALATELSFACAGLKAWHMRPGTVGLLVRMALLRLERRIPVLSGVAAMTSLFLALSAGVTSRAGCIGLGAVLALGAHFALYARVAPRFRVEVAGLGVRLVPARELAALQSRWEVVMTTRASLLAAAFVCVVAVVVLG